MKITGKITHIFEIKTGISKDGKEWYSLEYRVQETSGEYPQSAVLSIFGKDRVDNFLKYNKLNDVVNVEFNISNNEYHGKFYNRINSYRVEKVNENKEDIQNSETFEDGLDFEDDLPFFN